jgi:hypothetical protein
VKPQVRFENKLLASLRVRTGHHGVLTLHPGQGPEEEVWGAPRKCRRFATPSRVSCLNLKIYNPQDSILRLHFSPGKPKAN